MEISAEVVKDKIIISVAKEDMTCDNDVSEYLEFIRGVLVGLGHAYLEDKNIVIEDRW
jgi:hypothetical protein